MPRYIIIKHMKPKGKKNLENSSRDMAPYLQWHTQQSGWISRELCSLKMTIPKGTHCMIPFYRTLEHRKLQTKRTGQLLIIVKEDEGIGEEVAMAIKRQGEGS